MWGEKISRNLTLMNAVNVPRKTAVRRQIEGLIKNIKAILSADFFNEINPRIAMSLDYHDTNIFSNDPHYKCIKEAWDKLRKDKPEISKKETAIRNQAIMTHLRSYAQAIILYVFRKYFNFNIERNEGETNSWNVYGLNHEKGKICLRQNDKRIITLTIYDVTYNIIVTGNNSSIDTSILSKSTYIFAYAKGQIKCDKIINIDILDPDSVERVASFIRTCLLRWQIKGFVSDKSYGAVIKGAEDIVSRYLPWVSFDSSHNTYKIKSGVIPLIESEASPAYKKFFRSELATKADKFFMSSSNYNKIKPTQRDEHKKKIYAEISRILLDTSKIRMRYLFCNNPNCLRPFQDNELANIRRLECICGFRLDLRDNNRVLYYNNEEKRLVNAAKCKKRINEVRQEKGIGLLSEEEFNQYYWGMDYLDFSL
jgi:hypothetical protein